jgi:hypothetical protein
MVIEVKKPLNYVIPRNKLCINFFWPNIISTLNEK